MLHGNKARLVGGGFAAGVVIGGCVSGLIYGLEYAKQPTQQDITACARALGPLAVTSLQVPAACEPVADFLTKDATGYQLPAQANLATTVETSVDSIHIVDGWLKIAFPLVLGAAGGIAGEVISEANRTVYPPSPEVAETK